MTKIAKKKCLQYFFAINSSLFLPFLGTISFSSITPIFNNTKTNSPVINRQKHSPNFLQPSYLQPTVFKQTYSK